MLNDINKILNSGPPCYYNAVYSPDGSHILSSNSYGGSSSCCIQIWKCSNYVLQHTFYGYYYANYSPDGRYIVCANKEIVNIYCGKTYSLIDTLLCGTENNDGQLPEISAIKYSPDCKKIAVALLQSAIWVFDVKDRAYGVLIKCFASYLCDIVYSQDGNYIVTANLGDYIKIWDSNTGCLVKTINDGADYLSYNSVAYSPDGKYLIASNFHSSSIHVWDSASGSQIFNCEGHKNTINSACYSTCGKHILSSSRDGEVKIWDATTGNEIDSFECPVDNVVNAKYCPKGEHIVVSAFEKIFIYDNTTISLIETIHPLSYARLIGTQLNNLNCDDLTEQDIHILRQNGAIFNGFVKC